MNIKTIIQNGINIAVVTAESSIIIDVQAALDLIMTVKHETKAERVAIDKSCLTEDFFILSSGLAGEILQKFINYNAKIAIFRDYSKYTSKPLHDFIYESNKGRDVFFVESEKAAVDKLANV